MGNTILLADKSVTIQKIVQLTFADEEGFEIVCVNDGQSALESIPQIRPQIVLADIGLPVKSGYDVCTAMRQDPALRDFAKTPVILLAGIYETMDEERAKQVEEKVKEVGAEALLSKPFDTQLLLTRVKELISGASVTTPAAAPIFAESPAHENVFEAAAHPEESFRFDDQPPDDTEKTMMLPGPPTDLDPDMFAAGPPAFEESMEPSPARSVVDPDLAKPEGEMVFEEQALAELPQEPVEETPAVEQPVESPFESASFPGFQEPELTMEPEPREAFEAPEPPAPSASENAFEVEEPVASPAQEMPAIVTGGGDDPFGDVFGEPAPQAAWTPSVASEEESPFGVPEPPPPPPAPPEPEPEPEPVVAEQAAAVEDAFNAPMTMEEPSEAGDVEEMQEMMSTPSAPDFGEDTWSRAKAEANQEQPVEELFETTDPGVVAGTEEIELKADVTSPGIEFTPAAMAQPEPSWEQEPEQSTAAIPAVEPPPAEAAPSAAPVQPMTMEMSDDVIERIAQRVVEKLSERVIAEIVWQVVPDLAERMIRRELEKLHASND